MKANKLYESEFFGGNVANFTFEYLTDNDTDDGKSKMTLRGQFCSSTHLRSQK